MADDSYALASITARALASVLQTAAARLPLAAADGQAVRRTVYTVGALMAPGIRTLTDVAAIGLTLATAVDTLRTVVASPTDAAPVFYEAASASANAAPRFASPGRTRAAALGVMLAEAVEAAWLGEAFVAEAQSAFADQQSAIAARKRIGAAVDGALDRIAAAAVGREVIDILTTVARTSAEHIATVAADLKPVRLVQTARSAPSSALAYALHGDPTQAIDLVGRNKVATPLFMPTRLYALAPDA